MCLARFAQRRRRFAEKCVRLFVFYFFQYRLRTNSIWGNGERVSSRAANSMLFKQRNVLAKRNEKTRAKENEIQQRRHFIICLRKRLDCFEEMPWFTLYRVAFFFFAHTQNQFIRFVYYLIALSITQRKRRYILLEMNVCKSFQSARRKKQKSRVHCWTISARMNPHSYLVLMRTSERMSVSVFFYLLIWLFYHKVNVQSRFKLNVCSNIATFSTLARN